MCNHTLPIVEFRVPTVPFSRTVSRERSTGLMFFMHYHVCVEFVLKRYRNTSEFNTKRRAYVHVFIEKRVGCMYTCLLRKAEKGTMLEFYLFYLLPWSLYQFLWRYTSFLILIFVLYKILLLKLLTLNKLLDNIFTS